MDEHVEYARNASRCIVTKRGEAGFETGKGRLGENALGCRLGENLHGRAVAARVEGIAQTRVVVHEVGLSPGSEERIPVDAVHGFRNKLFAVVHHGVFAQMGEEGLHVVGDAKAELVVGSGGNARRQGQVVARGEALEAADAGVAGPGSQADTGRGG